MQKYLESLAKEETTTLTLSALYERLGYRKYRNTRFEEYSFYHDHQGFLSGEGVITFNNADGQLMALKPDMTLSIIKNADISPRTFSRVYYNENVYRFQQSTREYNEIHQCGLEMLGPIDSFAVGEIVLLALQSLEAIDPSYMLSLSHAELVDSALASIDTDHEVRRDMAQCIRKKNKHDLRKIAEKNHLPEEKILALEAIVEGSGPLLEALSFLEKEVTPLFMGDANGNQKTFATGIAELKEVYQHFADTKYKDHLHLDTSVINPVDYYSGIVMQGYVKAVPQLVLAGGRYDRLAEKLREDVGAMGFAVYLDQLQVHFPKTKKYDVDVLILYPEEGEDSSVLLMKKLLEFAGGNESVRVEPKVPAQLRARRMLRYNGSQWEEIHA